MQFDFVISPSAFQEKTDNKNIYSEEMINQPSMFPKIFFKKLIMGFCREFNSEQLLILNIMLKIGSYSSGNRRNFERAYGFSPTKHTFSEDFFTILTRKPNF